MGVNKNGSFRLREITRSWTYSRQETDPALSVSQATGVEKQQMRTEHAGYGPLPFAKAGPSQASLGSHVAELKIPKNSPPHGDLGFSSETPSRRKHRSHSPRKVGSEGNR